MVAKVQARKAQAWYVASAPSSSQNAGLIIVGRQQPQQGSPEVTKLLLGILCQDALPNSLQWDVASHTRDDLLHEAGEQLLQRRPLLLLQSTSHVLPVTCREQTARGNRMIAAAWYQVVHSVLAY